MRSTTKLAAALVAALVVLAGTACGGTVSVNDTVTGFFTAVADGDGEAACKALIGDEALDEVYLLALLSYEQDVKKVYGSEAPPSRMSCGG